MRRFGITFTILASFAVTISSVWSQTMPASTSSPASGSTSKRSAEEVGEIVSGALSELKSDSIYRRNEAYKQLRALGRDAVAGVSAAMSDGSYSPEAIGRMKDVIAWADYPYDGAVWRKVFAVKDDEDFFEGDIVLSVDEKEVKKLNSLRRVVPKRTGGKHRYVVWRGGKKVDVYASIEPISGGFRTWPDDVSIYQIYAAKGKWDSVVDAAIRGLDGRDRQDRFKQAYDAGCTDAWFLSKWIEHLRQNGMADKAQELLPLQKDAVDGTPGGLVKYGWGPIQAACTLVQLGKRDQAQAIIEQALADGKKADAWQGVPVLARYYISFKAAESYKAAMDVWSKWKDVALSLTQDDGPDIELVLAHMTAAHEGVDKAIEFIDQLPPSEAKENLTKYYAAQRELAGKNKDVIPPNLVPIYSSPTNLHLRKTNDAFSSFTELLTSSQCPGRLEFKIRMLVREPYRTNTDYCAPGAFVKLIYGQHFCGGNRFESYGSDMEIAFWMNTDGSLMVYDHKVSPASSDACIYRAYELRKWHDVAIDILPRRVRVYMDGVLFRDIQLADNDGAGFMAVDDGGEWELSDIRYWAYVSEKYDNEVICKLWDQLGKSVSSSPDIKQACQARDDLKKMLAGVAPAKKHLEKIDVCLEQFEKIVSKDGFQIDSKEAFDLLVKNAHCRGRVEYDNGTIILARGAKKLWKVFLKSPMYLPDDFQITGVFEARKFPQNSMAAIFWWSPTSLIKTTEELLLEPADKRIWLGARYFSGPGQPHPDHGKKMYLGDPIPFCIRVKNGKSALFLNFGAKPDLTLEFIRRDGDGLGIEGAGFDSETEFRISKLKILHLPKEVAIDEPLELPTPSVTTPTSGPTAQSTSRPASQPTQMEQKTISQNISDLESENILVRHKAHQLLCGFGRKATDLINAAISGGSCSQQAVSRLTDIVKRMDYPVNGAVWRVVDDIESTTQFADGDIVLTVDGEAVESCNALFGMISKRDEAAHRFLVHRNGANVEIESAIDKIRGGFRDWPDDISVYELYAAKGKWDSDALAAIRGLDGRDRQNRYQTASDAGCTDAWFLAKWIEHLRQNGMPDKAEELLARQKDAVDGSPGGLTKYGWGPVQAACTLIQRGKREQAKSLVEQFLVDGRKSGAWQGTPVLAKFYISMMMAESYDCGMQAWRQYGDDAMTESDNWSPDITRMMACMIAAHEGPKAAVEFVAKLPMSPKIESLSEYCKEQSELASSQRQAIPANLAPIFSMPANFFSRSAYISHGDYARVLSSPPTQGRLTFKVRMVIRGVQPTDSTCPQPITAIRLLYGNESECDCPTCRCRSDSDVEAWFSTDGSIGVSDKGMASSNGSLSFFRPYNIRQWHDFAIDILDRRVRVYLDGQLIRDVFFAKNRSPRLVNVVNTGGGWEFAEFRYWAYTDAKIDGGAICKLWDELGKAVSSSPDATKARQAAQALKKELAAIPQAKGYLDELDVNLDRFAGIMSKDGFEISTPEAFELFEKFSYVVGKVQYKDGTIVMKRDEEKIFSPIFSNTMYLPDDFQITGVAEIIGGSEHMMASIHWWNSTCGAETWSSIFLSPYPRHAWFGPHYGGPTKNTTGNWKEIYLGDPIPFGIKVKDGKGAMFLNFGMKPDLTSDFVWRDGNGFSMGGYVFEERSELRISKLKFSYLPKEVSIDEPMNLPSPPAGRTSQPSTQPADDGNSTPTFLLRHKTGKW